MGHDVEYPEAPRCYGAEDETGTPICDGDDVRHVHAIAPGGEWFETDWCSDCRLAADVQGYVIVEVAGDVVVPQGEAK